MVTLGRRLILRQGRKSPPRGHSAALAATGITWLFRMTAALGVLLIAATAIGTDRLTEHVTADDSIAVLDHPMASSSRRTAAERSPQ